MEEHVDNNSIFGQKKTTCWIAIVHHHFGCIKSLRCNTLERVVGSFASTKEFKWIHLESAMRCPIKSKENSDRSGQVRPARQGRARFRAQAQKAQYVHNCYLHAAEIHKWRSMWVPHDVIHFSPWSQICVPGTRLPGSGQGLPEETLDVTMQGWIYRCGISQHLFLQQFASLQGTHHHTASIYKNLTFNFENLFAALLGFHRTWRGYASGARGVCQ